MLKLKDNYDIITNEDYKKVNNMALVCELGFYIGTKEYIDEYIKNNLILNISFSMDNYILFYKFCEYAVAEFERSNSVDIYAFIENYYKKVVEDFIKEHCEEEELTYNMLLQSDDRFFAMLEVVNGFSKDYIETTIHNYLNTGIYNCKVAVYENFEEFLNEIIDMLNRDIKRRGKVGYVKLYYFKVVENSGKDYNVNDFVDFNKIIDEVL